MQWYYAKNDSQFGPVSDSEIRGKLQSGELQNSDMVWRDGFADWLPISSVSEFAMLRQGPPPSAMDRPAIPNLDSPYAPPLAPGGYFPSVRNSGLAIASMVLGILGLLLCQLISIGGVIYGHLALAEIKRSDGGLSGRGMAIAGLITGYLGVAVVLLGILVVVLAAGLG